MKMASAAYDVGKGDFDLENSQEYVEVVMSSKDRVSSAVNQTPNAKPVKKRQLSDPELSGTEDSAVKKSKNEKSSRERARKVLKRKTSDNGTSKTYEDSDRDSDGDSDRDRSYDDDSDGDKSQRLDSRSKSKSAAFRMTRAEVHVDSDTSTNKLILKMSEDMHSMFENLTIKMETMASEIEKKLSQKFANMLDKRIGREIEKVKKDVESRITLIKDDLYDEMKDIDDKIEVLKSDIKDCDKANNREQNIVLRNVPERQYEVVPDFVSGILKDGLRLTDVSVKTAVRIHSQRTDSRGTKRNATPDIIIATLNNKEDRQKVFENKKKLNESRNRHKGVFIHPDQSKEERQQRSNLKLVIDSVKSGNCNDLQLRVSCVVHEQGQPWENKDSRNEHRGGAFESRDRSDRYRSPTRERNNRNDRDSNRIPSYRGQDRLTTNNDISSDNSRSNRRCNRGNQDRDRR